VANETGEDHRTTGVEVGADFLLRQLARARPIGPRIAVAIVCGDHAVGPDVNGLRAPRTEHRRQQDAHRLFAGGHDAV
jgi:hypothetical protein